MQKDQTGRLDESVGSFGTIVLTIKWGILPACPFMQLPVYRKLEAYAT